MDKLVRREAAIFYKEWLKELDGHLLGLAEGNHYYQYASGETDTQDLCRLASIPYLEKPCFMRLVMKYQDRILGVFKVIIHHGDWGGSYSTTGADINAWENKARGFDFDIWVAAHTHRTFGTHKPEVTITKHGALKVVNHHRVFIKAGCFVTTYEPCIPTNYGQRKLMEPTQPGYVRLEIQFYRKYESSHYSRRKGHGGPGSWQHSFKLHY